MLDQVQSAITKHRKTEHTNDVFPFMKLPGGTCHVT